jgi:hypothetical protein
MAAKRCRIWISPSRRFYHNHVKLPNWLFSANHRHYYSPDIATRDKCLWHAPHRQLPPGNSLSLRYVCPVSKRIHFSGSRPKGFVQWISTFSYIEEKFN